MTSYIIVAIAGSLLATPAIAQSSASDADIVVTASGFTQPREETGQAITVIDVERLRTTQTEVISDVLSRVPGVSVARSGGIGAQTSAFIRGGDSSQTLVLIDGVRINDPSSPNAAFDFGALLTGNVERIEVLRGPNSVIWGSQAIGGVVNIVNAVPRAAVTVDARAEYGWRDTANLQANISGTTGPIEASVGGGYYRTDGVSTLSAGRERDGYENVSANARVKLTLSPNWNVDLRGYFNRGIVEFDDPFGATPDSFPVTRNRQFVGYVGVNASLLDGRLNNRLSYARTDIRRRGSEDVTPVSFNVNALTGTIDRFENHAVLKLIDALTFVAGVEHERSVASVFFPANGPGTAPDSARTRVTSVFGQIIARPLNGLTLTGGIRYDDYNLYGGETTFGGNLAYTPNAGSTVFRATYAEGFRAPTLTEALLPFGNPTLRPETARSFDLGIEQQALDGRLTASLTYFRRNSRDLITFSFTTFQSENIARARSQGLEFALAAKPTDRLVINASYANVDATSRTPDANFGNRLARRPAHQASVEADWRTPLGFSLGGTLSLTGDSFDNLANSRPLDGFVLAGVRAAYPISDAVELYGRVENAFDADYETVAGYSTLGRNAHLGLRVRL